MASLREHAPDGAIRGQDRNKAEKPMRGAESPDYAIGRALAQLVGSRPGYEVRQEAAHWRDAVPDVRACHRARIRATRWLIQACGLLRMARAQHRDIGADRMTQDFRQRPALAIAA
jgi:hypothetical protein